MEFIISWIQKFLHLDQYLDGWVGEFGIWIYAILFLIIFAETGLVITPFLPGDSLLFAVGAISARGVLSLALILVGLSIAAIIGDALNYAVGRFLGDAVQRRFPKIVKPEYIEKTHAFYEKYGTKTIVLARFVPIVRTIAPFVAGIGKMRYRDFGMYNIIGGIFWIVSMTMAGYAFGNLEFIHKNTQTHPTHIVFVSTLPMIIEFFRIRYAKPAA